MKKEKQETIAILGAGLAGLAAGYELVKKGKHVVLFEKMDDVGGLARTIKRNGFYFDTGPHRWYTKSNMVNKWMLAVLKGEVIQIPRLTRIYFDKKFFFYPIRLTNVLTGIGITKSFQAVMDYGIARVKARIFSLSLKTMEDGYINQFGKTLYEIFFKRYSEKLWGQDCRRISIDWVGQRTRGLNILTILRATIIKTKNVVSLVDEFSYPERGIGRLAQKLSSFVKKHGGKVHLTTEVVAIYHKNDTITSMKVKRGKTYETITADAWISSIPINDLIEQLEPAAPAHILARAKKLQYRDELQVVLFIKKTHITPDTWVYVHPKEIPFMRFMEMDNWSTKLSKSGTTALVFEIACNEGDTLWKKTDQELIHLVKDSFIEEFRLVTAHDVLGGYVHRVEKEYPVYHIGYRDDLKHIKEYLQKFSNLQIVGRNGTFRYNNMDHSVEMGLYAAWNILAGKKKFDIESVNIEREYLEEKKIETPEDESVEQKEYKDEFS